MFKIGYDKKITMVQGDTGVIRMRISNYELSQGDEVRFAIANKANPSILLCQHSDKKIVLEKQVTVFEKDGSARIVIYPYDTEYLQPGKYLYEIQVKTKDGRIDTVVPLTSFTLMDGSIQGEFGQTTPSKPEPTPSEIELRFKRLENEIIPELGNRITNVENEIDSISSSLENIVNNLSVFVENYILPAETNHTRGIKEAIEIAETENKTLEFLSGKVYKITDTLTFNIGKIKVKGNKCTLDFSTMDRDKTAILLTNNENGYNNQGSYLEGFKIVGSGRDNRTIAIQISGGSQENSATHFSLDKINISHFQKGIEYGNYSYCIAHRDLDISYCDVCLDMLSGQTDYGENINFTSCTIYNSNIAFKISNDLGAFNLTNVSIDYCNKFFEINGGRIFVNNSHIEGSGTFEILGGNGSILNITSCWLVLRSSSNNVKFKNNNSLPIIIKDCSIESDFYDTKVCEGKVVFEGTTGYNTNNFASNYLDKAPIKNIRCIAKGGGTSTSQLVNTGYCEVSITTSSGEYETGNNGIKVYKKWGQGSSSTLQILIPLNKHTNYNNLKIRFKANKTLTGANISRKLNYVNVVENMSAINGILFPRVEYVTNVNFIADLTLDTNWKTVLYKNHDRVKPLNATHLLYEISMTQSPGEDYIYIDNIELNEF